MKLLDTTFLIDLAQGVEGTKKYLAERDLVTTQINMYEFVRGLFLRGIAPARYLQMLGLFEVIGVLRLDEYGAIKAAEISAELYRKGIPVDDCDCLTAGIALSKGISTIVTRNVAHFQRMKKVQVESY